MYPTHYLAKLPPLGIHWLHRDKDGAWQRLEPPSDWGVPEDWDDAPLLAEQFFLSAPEAAWSSWQDKPWQHGTERSEPDLYSKIASSRGSPGSILTYANRYGFLGPKVERRRVEKMLWPEYTSKPGFAFSEDAFFWAEPAYDWLNLLGLLTNAINIMENIASEPTPKQRMFLNWYNTNAEKSLGQRVEWDSATGKLKGELVASSLADLLMGQLLSASEANIKHRRCEQCQTLFPVHPGLGRPEKKFCSDACRMRAYRTREASKAKGLK